MDTATRFEILMHPREFKRTKLGTGLLTHLCLSNSALRVGLRFEDDRAVRSVMDDPDNFAALLFPGRNARNLSNGELSGAELAGRRLTVFILDGTWSCARKMLKLNPCLQTLPRLMFTPSLPSRFIIKQQPQEGCLATLEATHELLMLLARSGLDRYPQPDLLLSIFTKMQEFQLRCAADPTTPGYRRGTFSEPGERRLPKKHRNYFS
jgi:DTW domain-containing protein YfiP